MLKKNHLQGKFHLLYKRSKVLQNLHLQVARAHTTSFECTKWVFQQQISSGHETNFPFIFFSSFKKILISFNKSFFRDFPIKEKQICQKNVNLTIF